MPVRIITDYYIVSIYNFLNLSFHLVFAHFPYCVSKHTHFWSWCCSTWIYNFFVNSFFFFFTSFSSYSLFPRNAKQKWYAFLMLVQEPRIGFVEDESFANSKIRDVRIVPLLYKNSLYNFTHLPTITTIHSPISICHCCKW